MTLKQLRNIINNLLDDAVILIGNTDSYDDIETVLTEHHSDGRTHIIFSTLE